MNRNRLVWIACAALLAIGAWLLFSPHLGEPQVRLSTRMDTSFGEIAAARAAELAPGASIVLIAYADEDNPPEAALRRRDGFLAASKAAGLNISAVVSPIIAYRGKSSGESAAMLPFRDTGIDTTCIRHALTLQPGLIVSIEGVPGSMEGVALGRTRFFAADPYAMNPWAKLMEQRQLHAFLAYRKLPADSPATDKDDTATIAARHFVFITPATLSTLRNEVELPDKS